MNKDDTMDASRVKSLIAENPAAVPVLGVLAALGIGLFAYDSGAPEANKTKAVTAASAPATAPASEKTKTAAKPANMNATKVASNTAIDRPAVEKIVRDYLMTNPEILLEVQQALEIKMNAEREAQAKVAVTENAARIFRSDADPIYGNPDGDVTVVEFFDYNCGFCKRAIPHITELVENDKNVKVVFKEFPIFGEESEQAAIAALAAHKQGKYWEMHRALLEDPGRANRQKAMTIARKLNLDMAKFEADMQLPEIRKVITDAQSLAQEMGIQGTPHFLVGPQTIPGAPEDLLQQIQTRVAAVRKEGCTVC